MSIGVVLAGYAAVVGSLALLAVLLLARYLGRQVDLTAAVPVSPAVSVAAGDLRGGPTLLAFLSSSCTGCRNSLPGLRELADRFDGGPEHVLVAITGDRGDAADLERQLRSSSTVLGEAAAMALTRAYRVTLFPTFLYVAADGRIVANGHSIRELTGV